MRDIPSTSGGSDARPVAAVVLGVSLLVGAFLLVTGGAGVGSPTDVRVEVTATPADGPAPENETATVQRTVENGGVV